MTIEYKLFELVDVDPKNAVAVFTFSLAGEEICSMEIECDPQSKITELKKLAVESFSQQLREELDLSVVNFNFLP